MINILQRSTRLVKINFFILISAKISYFNWMPYVLWVSQFHMVNSVTYMNVGTSLEKAIKRVLNKL